MPCKKIPCKKCSKLIYSRYNKNEKNKSGLCHDCYKKEQDELKIKKWLETGDTSCAVGTTIRNCIRDYIFNEQNGRCAICGIENEWNGKKLQFVLDHVDGDASKNNRSNLRLVCPNCDSQLPTFKSKNKNSSRNHRKKYT